MANIVTGEQTVEIFIHARAYFVNSEPELVISDSDLSEVLDSHHLICSTLVKIDVPEFDIREGQLSVLRRVRDEELARHENKLNEIERDINTLLAITHEV